MFRYSSAAMDMPIARNGTAHPAEMVAPVSKVIAAAPLTILKYSSSPVRST